MIFSWQTDIWSYLVRLRGKLPHAILLHSREGMGAPELAQAFSQALLCESPRADGQGCGACPACNWFGQGNHPDFRLIQPESMAPEAEESDAKKEKRSEQIRIEQIRALQDFLAIGTHRGGLRVILLHPAEAMNENSQNALLKSIEEPPAGSVFLLVSHQPERLRPTVRSRCLKLAIPVPDRLRAEQWLESQGVADPGKALAGAGGAPLAALQLAVSDQERSGFLAQLRAPEFDALALAEKCQRLAPADFVTWMQRWSYDLLLSRLAGRVRYHVGDERLIADIARRCVAADLSGYLRSLARARALAGHPLNPKLFAEDLLLRYQRLTAKT